MSICFSGSPSLCFILFCGYSICVIVHSWLNNLIDWFTSRLKKNCRRSITNRCQSRNRTKKRSSNFRVKPTERPRKKIAQILMHLWCRITQFLPKMLKKDHCLPVSAKFAPVVKYSLMNSRDLIHVVSDVSLHVNMTPLTVDDRLLIKTSQI